MARSKSRKIFRFKKKKKTGETELARVHTTAQPPKTIEDLKDEVEDVMVTMKGNIEKIRDREGKLDVLLEQGVKLESEAGKFAQMTKAARRRLWVRAHKMKIILLAIVVFVVIAAIVTIILVILHETGVI